MTALTTGKECAQNGITGPMLLSYVSPTSAANLPEVETIMNGLLLELVRFKDQHSQCTLKTLYGWTKDLYGKRWPQEEAPTSFAINKSIERLSARLSKLKKQHISFKKDDSLQNSSNRNTFCQTQDYAGVGYYISVLQRNRLMPQRFARNTLASSCAEKVKRCTH